MSAGEPSGDAPAERQRIDLWLVYARVVKTRALAQRLVASGHVRVNGRRADGPGRGVRRGDVLTIALDRQVRVLRIADFADRRGPAPEARRLYQSLDAGRDDAAPAERLAPGGQSG